MSRRRAATAGLAAAVPAGLFLQWFTPLIPAVGTDWGPASVAVAVVAWTAHLALGAVLGVAYPALVARLPVATYRRRSSGRVALGSLYGTVLWATVGAVVPAAVAGAAGLPVPSLPVLSAPSLAAWVVYGVVVGTLATPSRGSPATDPDHDGHGRYR